MAQAKSLFRGGVEMVTSYVLVADVLGFQQIMRNVPSETRAERLADWLWLCEKPTEFGLKRQVVSDTLFVTADHSVEGLTLLSDLSKYLLEQGINRSLPLRGAIAEGDCDWVSDALWGPAVISAYACGQAFDWIGIVCDESVTTIPEQLFAEALVDYMPPARSEAVRIRPCVRWAVPHASDLVALTTRGFLVQPGESLRWPWLRKVKATAEFRVYLDLLDAAELSGAGFKGQPGGHLIEPYLRMTLNTMTPAWRSLVERQRQDQDS